MVRPTCKIMLKRGLDFQVLIRFSLFFIYKFSGAIETYNFHEVYFTNCLQPRIRRKYRTQQSECLTDQ